MQGSLAPELAQLSPGAEASRACGTPSVVARCLKGLEGLLAMRWLLSGQAEPVGEAWL